MPAPLPDTQWAAVISVLPPGLSTTLAVQPCWLVDALAYSAPIRDTPLDVWDTGTDGRTVAPKPRASAVAGRPSPNTPASMKLSTWRFAMALRLVICAATRAAACQIHIKSDPFLGVYYTGHGYARARAGHSGAEPLEHETPPSDARRLPLIVARAVSIGSGRP